MDVVLYRVPSVCTNVKQKLSLVSFVYEVRCLAFKEEEERTIIIEYVFIGPEHAFLELTIEK